MSALECGCTGLSDSPGREPCGHPATQEDFLCDHCRTVRCWESTIDEDLNDLGRCIRLGCPEHSLTDVTS